MKYLLWQLGQVVPHAYHSRYRDAEGNMYVSVWRQWLGRVSGHRHWRVSPS